MTNELAEAGARTDSASVLQNAARLLHNSMCSGPACEDHCWNEAQSLADAGLLAFPAPVVDREKLIVIAELEQILDGRDRQTREQWAQEVALRANVRLRDLRRVVGAS